MVNTFASMSITVLAVGEDQNPVKGVGLPENGRDTNPPARVPVNVILKLEKEHFQVGEVVNIDLRLENNSEDDISLQPFKNMQFKNIENAERPKEPLGDITRWESVILEMCDGRVLAKGGYVGLKKFGGFKFNQPGKFVLWLTHYGPQCPRGIRSNALSFTILE